MSVYTPRPVPSGNMLAMGCWLTTGLKPFWNRLRLKVLKVAPLKKRPMLVE